MFKELIKNVHISDLIFSCLWLYCFFNNVDHKYDLDRLTAFYGVVRLYVFADKRDDSVNNSKQGEKL